MKISDGTTFTLRLSKTNLQKLKNLSKVCGMSAGGLLSLIMDYYLYDLSRMGFLELKIESMRDNIKELEKEMSNTRGGK